jgi:hypothetical protein
VGLNPSQQRFMDACRAKLSSGGGTCLYSAGTGAGKTYVGITVALWLMLSVYPASAGVLVVPTYQLGKMVHVPAIEGFLAEALSTFPDRGYTLNASDLEFRLFNGSTLRILSGDKPERIVAASFAWAWIDEPGTMKAEVWSRLLGRMRGSERPLIYLTGTPEGLNWVYDKIVAPGKAAVIYGSSYDNRENLPDFYLDDVLQGYSEKERQAWVAGQFVDLTHDRAYWAFDRAVHAASPVQYVPGLKVVLAVDFNVAPLRWVLCQVEANGDLRVPDGACIDLTSATTPDGCVVVNRILDGWGHVGPVYVYGDPAGLARSTRSHSNDYDLIRAGVRGATIRTFAQAAPAVRDRVNAVNAALSSGRLVIGSTGNEPLVQDLERVSWKNAAGTDLDKGGDPKLTHVSDAVGYYIAKEMPVNRPRAYRRAG